MCGLEYIQENTNGVMIMDNKLTDSEIVNALEDFINHNGHCVDCPSIMKYAFDLINRLQAENEKLKKVKYIFSTVDYCESDLAKALKENEELKSAINGFRDYEHKIKAEAYKECIEKVNERLAVHSFTSNSTEYTDGMLDCMEWVDSKIEELKKSFAPASLDYCKFEIKASETKDFPYVLEVQMQPAFLMHNIAAVLSNQMSELKFVAMALPGYLRPTQVAVISAYAGGIIHPHTPETYYVIVDNITAADFK